MARPHFEAAIELAERRGNAEMAALARSSMLDPLYDLGEWDELLNREEELATQAEASQDVGALLLSREAIADIGINRGQLAPAREWRDWMVQTAELIGEPQSLLPAINVVSMLALEERDYEQAGRLLRKLEEVPNFKEVWHLGAYLPDLVRTALTTGDRDAARALVQGVDPTTPWLEHALLTGAALLEEADGEHERAAGLFADAAHRWERFGSVYEQAHALTGYGRCLLAVGAPDAQTPLHEAREIFVRLKARPLIERTDQLLAKAMAS